MKNYFTLETEYYQLKQTNSHTLHNLLSIANSCLTKHNVLIIIIYINKHLALIITTYFNAH